jgi:hypothetical protein
MESVYLETTFISYLVARPSRDLIVAGHQQTTQDWWANRRSLFECFVSQVVIDESSAGDPNEIQKRLAIIANLPALDLTTETGDRGAHPGNSSQRRSAHPGGARRRPCGRGDRSSSRLFADLEL